MARHLAHFSKPRDFLMTSAQENDHQTIELQDEGRTVASAEVHVTDSPGVVHTDLHVASGPLPSGTRARLVDAVLEHPDVHSADHLVATMPLGDTGMLERVRERCDDVEAHAAGATKIVDARLTEAGGQGAEQGTPGGGR
jgi:hypothetical protein